MKLSKAISSISSGAIAAAIWISPAFAAKVQVQNLVGTAADPAIACYMKNDPKCNSCRGNSRSHHIWTLEVAKDQPSGTYYFQGDIGGNSNHPCGPFAYGAPVSDGNGPGMIRVNFSFPIHFVNGAWVADYSKITSLDGKTPVEKVTQKRVPFVNAALNNLAGWGMADLIFASNGHHPSASMVEIDLEQVFETVKPHLNAPAGAQASSASSSQEERKDDIASIESVD